MPQSDKNRKISLPALLRVPNAKELEGMLLQSIAHRGEMLELNFQSSETRTHILQAITGRRAGEGAPTWYLYSDDESEVAPGDSHTSGAGLGQGSQSSSSHNAVNNARSILKPPRNPNAFKPMEQTLEWIHQTGDINHLLSLIESALVENQKRQSDTGNKPEFVPYSQAVTKPAPTTKAYRPIQFENVEHFKRQHILTESGILKEAALLYLVELEWTRHNSPHRQEGSKGFTLLSLRPRLLTVLRGDDEQAAVEQPINQEVRREFLSRIDRIKRRADQLGHFQQDDFLILAPLSDFNGGRALAGRLIDALLKSTMVHSGEKGLILYMSLACLPEDCEDWTKFPEVLERNERRLEPLL